MPVDPTFLATGPEWSVGSIGSLDGPSTPAVDGQEAGGIGFGEALAKQIGNLEDLQHQAAQAARDLATGAAADPTAAVVAVDRARLAMQLAAQLRTKAVEAFNDVFHTQV